MTQFIKRITTANYSWLSLFEGAFLCAWVYVFLEWLFIATKPSFFSAVSMAQKVRVLFFSALLLAGLVLLGLAMLFLLARISRNRAIDHGLRLAGALALALILASLSLLLVDNFTYTVFGFGIISTSGLTVVPYLIGFLLLIEYQFVDVKKILVSLDRWLSPRAWRKPVNLGFAVLLVAGLVLTYQRPHSIARTNAFAAEGAARKTPNILLITADGLDADHTSLYGYERETTPHIKSLAQDSLVAQNAFNNSGSTMGSVISMYTSRHPTTTRTLYAPDILKGEDAYQHLPNILRQLGYYNVQYTYPHHADAYARNVLAGFDEANGKTQQQNAILSQLNRYLATDAAYFQYEVANRLIDRLRHITFNKRMLTQQEILFGAPQIFYDSEKVEKLFRVLNDDREPVFAHIHWMGTHGPMREPVNRTFSAEKSIETQEPWDVDIYDDSILDFDDAIGQIVDRLKLMGLYDNTILIISSDHSQNNGTITRIPMLIHFPKGQHRGELHSNVQMIDLAPTLLDYLELRQPAWMEGVSLLKGEPGERAIFAVGVGDNIQVDNHEVVSNLLKPPFYQFGFMSVVYCGSWYELDLTSYQWKRGEIPGMENTCASLPSDSAVLGWMRDRLAADGFDVSSLSEVIRIEQ